MGQKQKIEGWEDYNVALIPTTPPHENPKVQQLQTNNLWGQGRFLVRYTTDFDCGYETEWWWLIKDDELDISQLKKKRRYEITSSLNNFEVRKISPKTYAEQIYNVYEEAIKNYDNDGQDIPKERFIGQCVNHNEKTNVEYYGAFDKGSGELAAYALNHVFDEYVNFAVMKFVPKYLSKKVSAALVYTMVIDYLNIKNKKYINDGERSIRHITNFQDYLIKYFGFRRAYCKLHIQYNPAVGTVVKLLYPFRKIMKKFAVNPAINNVSSLLDMEKIRRSFKEK